MLNLNEKFNYPHAPGVSRLTGVGGSTPAAGWADRATVMGELFKDVITGSVSHEQASWHDERAPTYGGGRGAGDRGGLDRRRLLQQQR
jgi:hypothetical protein